MPGSSTAFLIALLGLIVTSTICRAQSNPAKLATSGRFDLTASVAVGALNDGVLLDGAGFMGRHTWRPAAEHDRTYTVNPQIVHFAWTKVVFRFVPLNSGPITLSLMGPWEQSPGSGIYRQEVYWDQLSAEGAVLTNGSFENVSNGLPTGWLRPFGDAAVIAGPDPALDGQRYARTWHDGPLNQTFLVTGGQPVTLTFQIRARLPVGVADMVRIEGTNTPAHRMARRLMRGANLGNHLEAPPGENWGASYGAIDFERIRAEGFDHVRLPIAWHHYTGPAPGFALPTSIFNRADFLVTNALANGLQVIVNMHHFDPFTSNPEAQSARFYAIWRQIAEHYKETPVDRVVFELLNEPKDAATTEVMNVVYAEAIQQVRDSNPNRTLMVGPGQFNNIAELGGLRLPAEDDNLLVTVHSYDPFLFTHQGASWTGADTATRGIVYPGPPATPRTAAPGVAGWVVDWINAYNTQPEAANPSSIHAFRGRLQFAGDWSTYYGRPVHIGEFGAYELADSESRARFYRDFRATADALGLGWAVWDWKAGFRYWNDATGAPAPGMREALFPQLELRQKAAGVLEIEGAVGKRIRIEKATRLNPPIPWVQWVEQELDTPLWQVNDPVQGEQSFYRAVWIK